MEPNKTTSYELKLYKLVNPRSQSPYRRYIKECIVSACNEEDARKVHPLTGSPRAYPPHDWYVGDWTENEWLESWDFPEKIIVEYIGLADSRVKPKIALCYRE